VGGWGRKERGGHISLPAAVVAAGATRRRNRGKVPLAVVASKLVSFAVRILYLAINDSHIYARFGP
jgi:hypothetical protein